jgi:dihydrofolate synthase / folylpolyglutamate synthase
MQEFRSFRDVHDYLGKLMSETRSRQAAYTLDRMQTLMQFLGNPQDSYRSIHVAGTSGKTSTCYYLSALLEASGKKVGLGISPHVEEVNERVQINNTPLGEQEFCREFSSFLQLIEPSGITPTYFELLVAFGFWEFARQKVEYAVIEVGLGGLLDGTNVMTRSDKLCVITDIGYDHTSILGKTLPAITAQKAGIILPHNPVFSYGQSPEIMQVLRETCAKKQAELYEISQDDASHDLPLFQQRNWNLAYEAYTYLVERDNLPKLTREQIKEATHTLIPARMEVFQLNDKAIILDGAHNPQKLDALTESMEASYPNQPIACLLGFVRINERKVRDNLAALLPHIAHLIITGFQDEAAEHHSTDTAVISSQCKALEFQANEVIPEPIEALEKLLQRPEPILLITGSFFLLQHLRPLIINKYDQVYRRR